MPQDPRTETSPRPRRSGISTAGLLVSFVFPVRDEERGLVELYDGVVAAIQDQPYRAELIFVDDGSSDGSFATLCELHANDSRIVIVQLRRNFGKAAAYAAGFRQSRGEVIVTMDSDLQDDPADIPRVLGEVLEGHDLAVGWKQNDKGSLDKPLPSRVFNRVVRWVTGVTFHDINCPFRAMRREVLSDLPLYGDLHRYIPVLAAARGFRIAEVKVRNRARKYGRSHYGTERYLHGLLDLLTVVFLTRFSKRPLHLLAMAGIAALAFGGAILTTLIGGHLLYLAGTLTDPGWSIHERPALSLGILLLLAGVQLMSIGLLGELVVTGLSRGSPDRGYSVRRVVGS